MKSFDVVVNFGADQLADSHPDRDQKRGGTGNGVSRKRTLPLPETDAEVPAAVTAFNKLTKTKGYGSTELSLVAIYKKAATMFSQADMHAKLRNSLGKEKPATSKTKDTSKLEEV